MNTRMRIVLPLILPLLLLTSVPVQAAQWQRQDTRHSERGHYQTVRDRDQQRRSREQRGAEPYHRPPEQRRRQDARPGLSASQAADRARARAGGGRVLSVRPSGAGYQVKLLKHDGTVHVVNVGGD